MRWWRRYQGWQLDSRERYVATAVGVRAVIVFFLALWLYGDSTVSKALLVTSAFVAAGVFVYGWIWYPRAKAKGGHTPVPMPRTQG